MSRLEEIKERGERVSAFNRHDQFGQFTTEDVLHLLEHIEHLERERDRLRDKYYEAERFYRVENEPFPIEEIEANLRREIYGPTDSNRLDD